MCILVNSFHCMQATHYRCVSFINDLSMLLISSSICRNQRKHDKEKEIVESTATHRDVDDVEAVDIDDKQQQVTYHDSISITQPLLNLLYHHTVAADGMQVLHNQPTRN